MESTSRLSLASSKRVEAKALSHSENTKCSNSGCGTTATPLWRHGPEGLLLCNRCGVAWKREYKHSRSRDDTKLSKRHKKQKTNESSSERSANSERSAGSERTTGSERSAGSGEPPAKKLKNSSASSANISGLELETNEYYLIYNNNSQQQHQQEEEHEPSQSQSNIEAQLDAHLDDLDTQYSTLSSTFNEESFEDISQRLWGVMEEHPNDQQLYRYLKHKLEQQRVLMTNKILTLQHEIEQLSQIKASGAVFVSQ